MIRLVRKASRKRRGARAQHSRLLPTEQFEQAWRLMRGVALERELRFCPGRRWRFDYAHKEARVAIEINGGIWKRGRHNRAVASTRNAKGEIVRRGLLGDYEKLNAAAKMGWAVFQLGGDMVDDAQQIEAIMDAIEERGKG